MQINSKFHIKFPGILSINILQIKVTCITIYM